MRRTGKVWIAAVAAAVMILGSFMAMAGTFDAWDYRLKITFAGYDKPETLTNFSTLVVLSTNIDNFSYTDFYSASGADLRFAGSNETTELNYEIEEWDTNDSSYIWVKLPELANTNDFIYAYWGRNTNAPVYTTNGATWSNGYVAVWHLKEEQEGTGNTDLYKDSTTNNNHGDDYISATGQVGQVDGGQEFDGINDYVEIPSSFDFAFGGGDFTWMAWIYPTNLNDSYEMIVGFGSLSPYFATSVSKLHFYLTSVYETPTGYLTQDAWQHVAITRTSGTLQLYLNGVAYGSTSSQPASIGQQTGAIGKWGTNNNHFFHGAIDEIRMSDVARGSNWVWVCWLNQASNNVFANYGDAEPNATNLTVITKPVSNIGVTNAVLNGNVLHTGDAENPHVYFCLGLTNAGTSSTGDWDRVEYMGTNWGKGETFSTNITGLLSGSNYHYRCYVTNSTGEDWSDDAQSFITIHLPAVTNTGATNVSRQAATLLGEITDTGGDTPYVWFYYWIDGNSSTSPAAIGLQTGAFSKQVSELTMATNYTYKILASNMAGTVWSDEKSFETLPFGTGTNIWTGGGVTDNWFEHANWSAGGVPLAGEHVIITNVGDDVLLTNSTLDLASFTITNATLIFTNWTTTLTASNVTIESGGELTLPSDFTTNQMSNCVHIVCTNFTLETGGSINADYKGYAGGSGSGADGYGPGKGLYHGNRGSGAGYGGHGGDSRYLYAWQEGGGTYGSVSAPAAPGSGGGMGGSDVGSAGGGAVRIEATNVTVNGTITADGQNGPSGYSGAGSGGTIFITCSAFGGTGGSIGANGGAGGSSGGGGGGGGRIALHYESLMGTPSVRFEALRGIRAFDGWGRRTTPPFIAASEMGTLYFSKTNMLSTTLTELSGAVIASNFMAWTPTSLTISNCLVGLEDDFELDVTDDLYIGTNGALVMKGDSLLSCGGNIIADSGDLVVNVHSQLTCSGNIIVTNGGGVYLYSGCTNGAADYGGLVDVTGDVLIYDSSWIYPYSDYTNGGSLLLRMSNLMIGENGGINASERGFSAAMPSADGYGPGHGLYGGNRGSGAGYGGQGGWSYYGGWQVAGGITYGLTNAPVGPGSGGGGSTANRYGGNGGGLVRVEAGNVTVNGSINASGGNAGSDGGGGSGGGIYIYCNQFDGGANGSLNANGGNGTSSGGGPGGGGRVAVWYAVPESERQRILAGDMKRVSIITNASDYSEFSGTVSITNGAGGPDYSGEESRMPEPGTCIFLTVTPPSGTMFMAR